MTVGARRVFACATAMAVVCLVAAAGLRADSAEGGQTGSAAQSAGERVPMVEEVFKTVVLLRGIPVERYSDEEAGLLYRGIGTHIGSVVSQNAKGDLLGHVL